MKFFVKKNVEFFSRLEKLEKDSKGLQYLTFYHSKKTNFCLKLLMKTIYIYIYVCFL